MKDADVYLPPQITTPHGKRLQTFLRKIDDSLQQEVQLVVYGSAALRLYLKEFDLESVAMTSDIDVGHTDPESIELPEASSSVYPPLEFQSHPIENWLIHPDWRQDTTNASELVGTRLLTIELHLPVDLCVLKVSRNRDRDGEKSHRLFDEIDLSGTI